MTGLTSAHRVFIQTCAARSCLPEEDALKAFKTIWMSGNYKEGLWKLLEQKRNAAQPNIRIYNCVSLIINNSFFLIAYQWIPIKSLLLAKPYQNDCYGSENYLCHSPSHILAYICLLETMFYQCALTFVVWLNDILIFYCYWCPLADKIKPLRYSHPKIGFCYWYARLRTCFHLWKIRVNKFI